MGIRKSINIPGTKNLIKSETSQTVFCPRHNEDVRKGGPVFAFPIEYGEERANFTRPAVIICLDCFLLEVNPTPRKGALIEGAASV